MEVTKRVPGETSVAPIGNPNPTVTIISAAVAPMAIPWPPPTPMVESSAPTPTPTPITTPPHTFTPVTPSPESKVPVPIGQEILFLRSGNLVAADVMTKQVRQIASDVREYAASPDGMVLAVVRGRGRAGEIWLVSREGQMLRQLTNNQRSEGQLSWNNNGSLLVYASSTWDGQRPTTLREWASWCHSSEIRLLDLATATETAIEPGCSPAFSPDGRRIAFATPPEQREQSTGAQDIPTAKNAIRLINSRGENGWNFAVANPEDPESGLLVYAPSWSPDGTTIIYQRFIGYRALVDINYIEAGGSFTGGRELMGVGSGWLFPAVMAPDHLHFAVVEYDPGNARGWKGYEQWRVHILRRGEVTEIALPDGPRARKAATVITVARATGVAWAPGKHLQLALVLPAEWSPGVSPYTPLFEATTSGAIWLWSPERSQFERFVDEVDYASPLCWLPAMMP